MKKISVREKQKVLVLSGNVLELLESILENKWKAKMVEFVTNNIDQAFYSYEVRTKTNEPSIVVIGIKEDVLGDNTTTVQACGEIIDYIKYL